MRPIRQALIRGVLLAGALAPASLLAQASSDSTTDTSAISDSAPKKHGLFGKVKSLAKSRVVHQVVKTAACTMVPGGQAIAGAIDAADNHNAAAAAAAATGTACVPGGIGTSGLAAGLAKAGMVGATAGAGATGGAPQPVAQPAGAMGYEASEGVPADEAIARCLGLTPAEFQAFADPTHGESRQMTKDEMKRQGELSRKIDMGRYQSCMMAQMSAGNEGR